MKLEEIAKKMCQNGKGILAADESTGTIAKRFKTINVENNETNRVSFRETLFSSQGMRDYIGGVILFDETIKQISSDGTPIPELIKKSGSFVFSIIAMDGHIIRRSNNLSTVLKALEKKFIKLI